MVFDSLFMSDVRHIFGMEHRNLLPPISFQVFSNPKSVLPPFKAYNG